MRFCIVVPCFNEEGSLPRQSFISFARANTIAVAEHLRKASAQDFTHIDIMDTDLTMPLTNARDILSILVEKNTEFIFASSRERCKRKKNQNIPRQVLDYLNSLIFKTVLHLPDQCAQHGANPFKSSIVQVLFEERFSSRWIFDIEIFFRLKFKYNWELVNHFFEYPVHHWVDIFNSKVRVVDYIKVPYQIYVVFLKFRFYKNPAVVLEKCASNSIHYNRES